MNKVSIVILNYDGWAMTHNLLFDIYKNCSVQFIHEVLVVNNGCTEPESFTGLEWWIGTGMLPIRELRIEKNVGFLLGANAGLKDATGDIIVLLSNDVRIYGDVVALVVAGATIDEKILIGGKFYPTSTGWNDFDGRVYPYAEGWLLASTKKNWEELDYFDERYAPNDYEDVDLSTKAFSLGFAVAQITPDGGQILEHLSGRTLMYNADREELTKKNREKFREKWKPT